MDSKKQESNILNLYTTPMLSGELANLQGALLSERYYLSVQKRGVKDLIDMLQKNLSGIYLLAIRSEKLQELNLREYTTIQQFSENYTVCHKSNPITPATYQRKNHMVIMHDYYEGNYGDYLRMSDLKQIKTLLREKKAVFNCTDFYYHKYFAGESEWVVLQKKEIPLFDIVLIVNDSFDQSISKELKKQIQKCFSSISDALDS